MNKPNKNVINKKSIGLLIPLRDSEIAVGAVVEIIGMRGTYVVVFGGNEILLKNGYGKKLPLSILNNKKYVVIDYVYPNMYNKITYIDIKTKNVYPITGIKYYDKNSDIFMLGNKKDIKKVATSQIASCFWNKSLQVYEYLGEFTMRRTPDGLVIGAITRLKSGRLEYDEEL